MGKPEQWAVSWGETRGKDCGEGQAGIHPGRSVRVVGSQQEGREEAQALPQFRETQPLSCASPHSTEPTWAGSKGSPGVLGLLSS